jgi:hypothetical protein
MCQVGGSKVTWAASISTCGTRQFCSESLTFWRA